MRPMPTSTAVNDQFNIPMFVLPQQFHPPPVNPPAYTYQTEPPRFPNLTSAVFNPPPQPYPQPTFTPQYPPPAPHPPGFIPPVNPLQQYAPPWTQYGTRLWTPAQHPHPQWQAQPSFTPNYSTPYTFPPRAAPNPYPVQEPLSGERFAHNAPYFPDLRPPQGSNVPVGGEIGAVTWGMIPPAQDMQGSRKRRRAD
jgi:hypothetical protein